MLPPLKGGHTDPSAFEHVTGRRDAGAEEEKPQPGTTRKRAGQGLAGRTYRQHTTFESRRSRGNVARTFSWSPG